MKIQCIDSSAAFLASIPPLRQGYNKPSVIAGVEKDTFLLLFSSQDMIDFKTYLNAYCGSGLKWRDDDYRDIFNFYGMLIIRRASTSAAGGNACREESL